MKIANRGGKIAGIAVFAAICILIFAYLYGLAGGTFPWQSTGYEFTALVPDAFQLVPNGDVRRAGVKIGKINSVSSKGDMAVIGIELDPGQGAVYRDGSVLVRTKTLVGENYLDLSPGNPTSGRLPTGGTLQLSQAGEAVQLDKILSGLDAPTRAAIRRDLHALGPGLSNRGTQLNELFGAIKPVAVDGGAVMAILKSESGELGTVVDGTGQVMQAFADRTSDVQRLAIAAKAAAAAAASRDQALGAAIDELPATLVQVRASVNRLASFSSSAAPVITNLRTAVRDLGPVFPRLRPAAAQARALFRQLPAFVRRANPMLSALRLFTVAGTPAIASLDALLLQANPILAYLQPYVGDVGAFFATVGSATDTTDVMGNLARLQLLFDPQSLTVFTPAMQQLLKALVQAGGLSQLNSITLNPYPKPGTAGNPQPFSGTYPRLQPGK
jgi:virulence factor Mce-like protein